MPVLPFGEFRPDVSDLNTGFTSKLRNVLVRADGYGPMKDIAAFTQAAAAACRGYFFARREDGSVAVFMGTSTKLYLLNNTTLAWGDVSVGAGTYSTLNADANWTFAQFNNIVLATQKNAVLQSYDLTSSSAFANNAGSPPQAGWIAIINRFVVLADLLDDPFRVQWSGLNAVTAWTAGTALSDFQDLPDGGRARSVAEMSGDVGLILQDVNVRRMIFAPGSDVVFQIDKLSDDLGIVAPYSTAVANGRAFFLSTKGFVEMDASGASAFIGEEKVDRTFLGQHEGSAPAEIRDLAYDSSNTQLVQGAADPNRNIVLWVYKSVSGQSGLFDRGLAYHWTLKRWSPVMVSGEYLAQVSRPGLTMEGLDAIAPGAIVITGAADNGAGLVRITVGSTATLTTGDVRTISGVLGTTEANGTWTITKINATTFDLQGSTFANAYVSGGVVAGSLDDLPFSLDDISTATLPSLAAFNSSHKLGFFSGATLEARIETAEQSMDGWRININGLRPITDAADVYGFTTMRDNLNAAHTDGDESAIDSDGFCPLLDESRYARGAIRIPAATTWNYARGVEPEIIRAGML